MIGSQRFMSTFRARVVEPVARRILGRLRTTVKDLAIALSTRSAFQPAISACGHPPTWWIVSATEVSMDNNPPGRRDFLKTMTAIGAVGLPAIAATRPRPVQAADGAVASAAAAYDPAARFEITVHEVEFRRTAAGRTLLARIYQPQGTGPFPTVLDLHGGAWNAKDRRAEEPMDRALASSGVLIVAIDMTLAPEAPYPACVQDANYGVRWLKWKAASWNGDPSTIGVYGSSSGGHVAELLGMRPNDPRYNAIPLSETVSGPGGRGPGSSHVAYVAMRSPVSNPVARYENAERLK